MKILEKSLICLTGLLLLWSVTACSDMNSFSRDNEKNQAIVQSELLDFFYFKTGSYWIYQDKESDTRDSVWVYADQLIFQEEKNAAQRFQEGYCHLKDIFYAQQGKSDGFILRHFSSTNQAGKHQSFLKEMRDGKSFYDRRVIRAECRENKFGQVTSSDIITYQHFSSFTVRGVTYKDVLLVISEASQDWCKKGYYARNLGLIYAEMEDGKTWELVQAHIEK